MQNEGSAYLQMSNTLDLDVCPQRQLVHSNAGPTLRSQSIRDAFSPQIMPKQKQEQSCAHRLRFIEEAFVDLVHGGEIGHIG